MDGKEKKDNQKKVKPKTQKKVRPVPCGRKGKKKRKQSAVNWRTCRASQPEKQIALIDGWNWHGGYGEQIAVRARHCDLPESPKCSEPCYILRVGLDQAR